MHVDIAFANISSSELLLIVELELVLFRNMPSVTYLVFFQKDHVICFYPFFICYYYYFSHNSSIKLCGSFLLVLLNNFKCDFDVS